MAFSTHTSVAALPKITGEAPRPGEPPATPLLSDTQGSLLFLLRLYPRKNQGGWLG